MSTNSSSCEARLLEWKEKESEILWIERKRDEAAQKLGREKGRSAARKAADLFSFPFKGDFLSDMFSTATAMILSFILSVIGGFVLLGILLFALIDLLYILLFGVFYPFALLYFALFGSLRAAIYASRVRRYEKALAELDAPAVKRRVRELERELKDIYEAEEREWRATHPEEPPTFTPPPVPQPPILGPLSTDPTLDLHPGDY